MDVALIYPPMPFLADPHSQPPLGLMYVAAALDENGHRPVFYDWSEETDWRSRLSDIQEDVVGCYCGYPHFNWIKKLYQELRALDKHLIVGGPDPSGHPHDYVDRADCIVVGEGEKAIINALRLHDMNGTVVLEEPYIEDIDAIPYPLRQFQGFDVRNFSQMFNGKKLTTAMFSRGCIYGCAFCDSRSVWGRKVRRRSPFNCFVEVRNIRDIYGFDAFFPEDDTFNLDNEWVRDFCELIRPLGISWRCLSRASCLNDEILSIMKASGCERISIGVESGSDKILKNISKGETVKQQMDGIKAAQRVGIEVQAFIIIGLPGENKQTLNETKRFLEEARPEYYDLTLLRVFPGSNIWKFRHSMDIEVLDFDPEATFFKGGVPVSQVRTMALTKEELETAYEEMYDFTKSLGAKHSVGQYINNKEYSDIKEALE